MTEISGNDGPGAGGGKRWGKGAWLLLLAVAGVAALAVLYAILHGANKPRGASAGLSGLNRGTMEELAPATPPKPAPATSFADGSGKTMTLADFKGQVVVVNLWATWCAPCKIEMPTLAKLQTAYAGRPVKVIALSVDRAEDAGEAKAFLAKHAPLQFYQDPQYAMAFAMQPRVEGLPTTVIYGADGLERARLAGEADWTSKEARAVIDAVLAQKP